MRYLQQRKITMIRQIHFDESHSSALLIETIFGKCVIGVIMVIRVIVANLANRVIATLLVIRVIATLLVIQTITAIVGTPIITTISVTHPSQIPRDFFFS